MNIELECETTEWAVISDKKIEKTVFNINGKSVVISFCDSNGKVIKQSEIDMYDAKTLSKIILNC